MMESLLRIKRRGIFALVLLMLSALNFIGIWLPHFNNFMPLGLKLFLMVYLCYLAAWAYYKPYIILTDRNIKVFYSPFKNEYYDINSLRQFHVKGKRLFIKSQHKDIVLDLRLISNRNRERLIQHLNKIESLEGPNES